MVRSGKFAWFGALATCAFTLVGSLSQAAERHAVLFQGQRLTIVDRGGLAIWQGDIVLGRTVDLLESTRIADLAGAPVAPKGTGIGIVGGRWPRGASGLFEMPYVIENDPEGRVPPAIVAYNQLLAGFFRAVPRTIEADYVAFTFDANDKTGPCFSFAGRQGGRQAIAGASNCSVPRLLHEMGHAMGLNHEQERGDRDRWVSIDFGLIEPVLAYNYVPALSAADLGIYDFGSIMHYGPMGFTKTGANVMETIPPGIVIGPREGYSRGDLESLRRLYGVFDSTVTVDTYPSGLAVVVDGVSRVTPATFTWALDSTHALEVPVGAQTLDGVVHAFARWSSDAAATLSPKQTITVTRGNGSLTQPSKYPAVSQYVANFVRMKEMRFTTQGNRTGVGGTVTVDPPPETLAGASGSYYRERQPFTVTPKANTGAIFGRWRGTFTTNPATSTIYTSQMRGPLAFNAASFTEFSAYFVDFPFTTVRASDRDGDVLGISATVTRANGSSASQRLPYNTTDTTTPWATGETGSVTFPTSTKPWAESVRYVLQDLNGATTPTVALVHPATGQPSATLVATYKKQYDPYRQVNPSCGGTMSVTANTDGWIDAGATMPATLTLGSAWNVTRWKGSLTGTGTSRTLVVNDVPDLEVDLNIVADPLEITSLSPANLTSARAVTLEIMGRGFASTSRVLVGGAAKTPSLTSANRIVVPLAASDFPATGRTFVTVQNRNAAGTCAVTASATFDTFVPEPSLDPTADSDGDGIPNGVEVTLGTNPLVRDNNLLAETLLGRQLLVMQQFRDFLNREGDTAGVNFWLGELTAGRQTRASMAESFLNSPEYQDRVAPIVRLYFATYLRIPDTAGLDYWIGRFLEGTPLATIAQSFAQAPEFTARYGNLSNRDYVTRLYQNILERAPDAAGANFWTARLDTGGSTRGGMLAEFSESAEFQAKASAAVYVTSMYRAFLRRAPDQGGFDYWRGQLAAGASGQALVNSFLGSPEYSGRFLP